MARPSGWKTPLSMRTGHAPPRPRRRVPASALGAAGRRCVPSGWDAWHRRRGQPLRLEVVQVAAGPGAAALAARGVLRSRRRRAGGRSNCCSGWRSRAGTGQCQLHRATVAGAVERGFRQRRIHVHLGLSALRPRRAVPTDGSVAGAASPPAAPSGTGTTLRVPSRTRRSSAPGSAAIGRVAWRWCLRRGPGSPFVAATAAATARADRPSPGLGPGREEHRLRLGFVAARILDPAQQRVDMQEQPRGVGVVARIADRAPQMHGRVGSVQHLGALGRCPAWQLGEPPGDVVGAATRRSRRRLVAGS